MVFDPDSGRITNATFGDYLIPANADVPDLDVVFVGTVTYGEARRYQGYARDQRGRPVSCHRQRRVPRHRPTVSAADHR
jgi:hypothetical protein